MGASTAMVIPEVMTVEWVTTSTILAQLHDFDNEAAWARFVDRFRDPVARFADRLGVPADEREDVVQETLLAFAQGLRANRYDREKGRLRQWLFGIAHHQIQRHHHRHRSSRARPAESDPTRGDAPLDAAIRDVWDREWEAFVIQACLGQLAREVSGESLRVFEAVALRGLAPQEAANELGLPVKSVYNAKHRALKRMRELRDQLERVDGAD